ncbi:sulfotransferase family protein (plasmid) [Sulfitobacter sp. W027]|uniref:sulfotransferase family protein n=1 Tax=Sulfitobacter sp. W027 TaxID=2867025 RepID=UPI0021A384C7|nr:sulfotransferase family protein [Sulfitobacter sp. W027]UWR35726.1 sulfotransferase family protein [Sulfitobacter sp. W027]
MKVIKQMRCQLADLRGRGIYAGWPDEHQAVFIHLPKTAGTSVSHALGLSASRHIPAEAYRMANPRKFAKFFKFAFVRNPYDRLLSSYAFLMNGGMNDDDARFAATHVQPFGSFSQFVIEGLACNPKIRAWVHFRPQTDFVCDPAGYHIMDFIGRFECISEDYETVAERIGVSGALPRTNRSRHGDYREAYNAESLDIVRQIYRRDLATFRYDFG